MVTSRQFVRGVGRTMRAMDRAAKQAERQRMARQQALHRQAHLDASAMAAAEYEEIVEALTGAHRVALSRVDWLTTATAPDVPKPERRSDGEDAAATRFRDYAPGWFARIFGREQKERDRLADEVIAARARDDGAHSAAVAAAMARNAEIAGARRVVDRDPDAMVAVLDEHSALGSLPFSVEGIDTLLLDGRTNRHRRRVGPRGHAGGGRDSAQVGQGVGEGPGRRQADRVAPRRDKKFHRPIAATFSIGNEVQMLTARSLAGP